jgi:6-phosphogluconate dehydrogenase
VTEQAIQTLFPLLDKGDTIVDGANTNFNDDIRRAAQLKEHGLNYIDQGTSGGIWGLHNGFCIMVGGEAGAAATSRRLCLSAVWE